MNDMAVVVIGRGLNWRSRIEKCMMILISFRFGNLYDRAAVWRGVSAFRNKRSLYYLISRCGGNSFVEEQTRYDSFCLVSGTGSVGMLWQMG